MEFRKCILACGFVLAFFAPVHAQGDKQELLDKKLKKEFIKKVAWEQNYGAAKIKALAEGKLILAYFTRSFAP